ncbi:hypothetical protein BT93_H3893 [Corymbia citriodora subsp. variegata]|nr:hypothetical protein BT93_H3893 [Corymbia citriodora subsp. variegata]
MENPERGTKTNIPLGGEYQVFINFRGCDVRRGFANTLYYFLNDAGICIFMDDAEIRAGEIIGGKLMQAIDNSKLYIPIFSSKYASSHWCLIELAKMMENISTSKRGDVNKKVMLPIFYDVEPAELKLEPEEHKLPRQSYRDAISDLEEKKVNQEKKFSFADVDRWRRALREAGAYEGLKLRDHEGDGDLSKAVVGAVLDWLHLRQRRVPKFVVGMEGPIAAINNLLDIGSDDVRLIGICGMSGIGTRILVTTKDESSLDIKGLMPRINQSKGLTPRIYQLHQLGSEDALQIFSRHAFDVNSPPVDYYTLSEKLVSTMGGLPLAVEAIGELLYHFRNDKQRWQKMMMELSSKPHDDVLGKLQITYDALTSTQQDIFLDIACFFINEDKTKPVLMWDDGTFSTDIAPDLLIKRCMIRILDNNEFWMHEQFIALGRAIAKKERTRLWDRDDILCQFYSEEDKSSVQALCFRQPLGSQMTVTAEQIKRFPNLRFLRLTNVNLRGDFAGCLSKLKWLDLAYYTSDDNNQPFMPTNLHLENVVVLQTWRYNWTEDAVKSLIKESKRLKVLIIEHCRSTHETTTFPECSVLEELRFLQCCYLKTISCSIGKLWCLTYLDFENCAALERLPEQIGKLKKLQHLSLRHCKSLRELPKSVLELESLTKLDLYGCSKIQELPELPKSLITLRLESQSLQSVPDVSNLIDLVELLLSDFFDWIGQSTIIRPCNLPCIGRLSKLKKLKLCLFEARAISTEWDSLSLLEELYLSGLDLQMLKLPANLRYLRLQHIEVKQLELDGLPSSLKMLQNPDLSCCAQPQKIQFISMFEALKEFCVFHCISLKKISGLSNLKNLISLKIGLCKNLQFVEGTDELERLEKLEIFHCESMEKIIDASISRIPKECRIMIRSCGQLPSTGPWPESITWECYREMILNAQTQVSDAAIKATSFETGDPPLEQQDDGEYDYGADYSSAGGSVVFSRASTSSFRGQQQREGGRQEAKVNRRQ